MIKRVLITGGAGYVGSTLVYALLEKGIGVRVVDNFSFGGEALLPVRGHRNVEIIAGDVREHAKHEAWLSGVDGIVHLAAIVGDPACAKQPDLATSINWDASKALYDAANKAGSVKRFVFASTCSNYGKMQGTDFVREDSPLTPVSLYARLKVQFEKYLLEQPRRKDLAPVALRFATVCGASPRMRFDLTVNEFARDFALDRELEVFGKQFWRPYCHVVDIARAVVTVLEAEDAKVAGHVFGVGSTKENYTKADIVESLLKRLPKAKVKFVHKTEDPRDYRVDFSKIEKQLGFTTTRSLEQTVDELLAMLKTGVWKDPYAAAYRNI